MPPVKRRQPCKSDESLRTLPALVRLFKAMKQELTVIGSALSVLATKLDLQKTEKLITMKVSEITGNLNGIKGQIAKISTEQQTRFDEAQAKIEKLEQIIRDNDPDLPEEANNLFNEVKTALQALDDSILDPEGVQPSA